MAFVTGLPKRIPALFGCICVFLLQCPLLC